MHLKRWSPEPIGGHGPTSRHVPAHAPVSARAAGHAPGGDPDRLHAQPVLAHEHARGAAHPRGRDDRAGRAAALALAARRRPRPPRRRAAAERRPRPPPGPEAGARPARARVRDRRRGPHRLRQRVLLPRQRLRRPRAARAAPPHAALRLSPAGVLAGPRVRRRPLRHLVRRDLQPGQGRFLLLAAEHHRDAARRAWPHHRLPARAHGHHCPEAAGGDPARERGALPRAV